MSVCEELEELVPAYVLGALSPPERTRLEKHLRHCPNLRDQISAYENVAAQLAYAVTPVEPRADMKYRVLAAIAPKPKFSVPNLFGFVRAPAFAVAALLLAIGLGIWNMSTQNQLSQQIAQLSRERDEISQQLAKDQKLLAQLSRERDQVSAVMAYGQGQPRELQGTEVAARSSGRLYSKVDQSSFVLAVHNLPGLEPGKVYQVWLVTASGDRTSGGIFSLDSQGYGWAVITPPKPLSEYRSIGITIEPDGGSPGPTGPRVMGTSL
jgi:anti-sigma-K factor RskA